MIYIDSEFKCHKSNPDGSFRAFDVPFFDDKCPEFIAGYRYIPSGESCVKEDGVVLTGEKRYPWKPYAELEAAQRRFEQQLLANYREALTALGVSV